jgi:uncharacterized protein (DUF169 family)
MDKKLQQDFIKKWRKYFGAAELPVVFFYSDDEKYAEFLRPMSGPGGSATHCIIGVLKAARKGKPVAFSKETMGCQGGARYSGYAAGLRPKFKYFLSCGIPGEMKGERYKKTPEIVEDLMKESPQIMAPGKYLVFKRWDRVEVDETPIVVDIFAKPDVLSGLFTLANFRSANPHAVMAPFSAGCGSIIGYPLLESYTPNQGAVIGMFDPSARPHVGENVLSFAAPMKKFAEMIEDMDESFLITPTWKRILKRIKS